MADLGNTDETGLATRSCAGDLRAILITTTEAGTLSSISAYVDATGTHSMYAYLYDASGNLLDQSTERTDIASTAALHTFSGFTASLSASTDYYLAIGADSANTAGCYWKGGQTFDGYSTSGFPAFTDATSPVDPATFGADGTRDFTIYMTYTPGGGTNPKNPLGLALNGPFSGPV